MGLNGGQERILDWMSGTDRTMPPTLRYFLMGAPRSVHSFYDKFIIMRPGGTISRFSRDVPDRLRHANFPTGTDMLRTLRIYQLSAEANEPHRRYLRLAFPVVKSDKQAWSLAEDRTKGVGLPLGVFAGGVSAMHGTSRMMLVLDSLVPPELFLQRFRAALLG
jgi:hypothetical protein